jgi:osmotically-inducible protein OsmY
MMRMRRMGFGKGLGLAVGLALGGGAVVQARPAVAATVAMAEAQPSASDEAITASIKARVDADKAVGRSQVVIATSNGIVTLFGTVPNTFARDKILEEARATPGVVKINDQLRIDISSPQAPTRN